MASLRSVPDGCASFFMVSAGGLMACFIMLARETSWQVGAGGKTNSEFGMRNGKAVMRFGW